VVISYGVFVNAVISFLIVAFAVFLLIKGINRLQREKEAPPAGADHQGMPVLHISHTHSGHPLSALHIRTGQSVTGPSFQLPGPMSPRTRGARPGLPLSSLCGIRVRDSPHQATKYPGHRRRIKTEQHSQHAGPGGHPE
jgi:hypothetical protein